MLSPFIKSKLTYTCTSLLITMAGCAHRQPQPHTIHVTSLEKALNNFHTVEPGVLYRSAQLSPVLLEKMIKKYTIKTIINLRGVNESKRWWVREKALAEKLGVTFHSIAMSAAHLPDKENLLQLLHLYESANRPILIHCYSGADRTGEAAALWAMEEQKKDKKAALKQLSIKYGHLYFKYPAKRFFINLWRGKRWLKYEYDPRLYARFR